MHRPDDVDTSKALEVSALLSGLEKGGVLGRLIGSTTTCVTGDRTGGEDKDFSRHVKISHLLFKFYCLVFLKTC